MTSAEKITSNRNNAKKSTGPKTDAGKCRTSQNALRYGLTTISPQHPLISAEIERIAKFICPDSNSPAFEQALIIAECEIVLRRVREARVALIEAPKQTPGSARKLLPGFPTENELLDTVDDLARGRFRSAAKRLKHAADSLRAHTKTMASNRSDGRKPTEAESESQQAEPCQTDTGSEASRGESNALAESTIERLRRVLPELLRLERYAQRALSRRKRAIGHFIANSLVDATPRRRDADKRSPSPGSR
jgi:hypothetical protein